MPVTSKRQLAILDLQARLAFVLVVNGFSSDAGANIFLGKIPKLGPSDPEPALAIVMGEDEPPESGVYTEGGTVRAKVPIWIHAIAKGGAQPLLVFEGLIADIKQAVEIEGNDPDQPGGRAAAWVQRYLGAVDGSPVTLARGLERGSTVPHYAEGGSEQTGASVQYFMFLEEKWGQP